MKAGNIGHNTGSIEWEVFIFLCKQGLSADTLGIPSHLELDRVDWQALYLISHKNLVRPLVHRGLVNSSVKDYVTLDILKRFKEAHVYRIRKNMKQAMELKTILKLLAQKNIHPIPYKGVLLSQSAFQSLGLREVADIDLLVDFNDFPEIEALFLSRNYVPTIEMRKEFRPIFFKQNIEYNFDLYDGEKRLFHVEPHWQIGSDGWQTNLNYHDVLPLTRKREFLGEQINLLTPEGFLITTSLHHGGGEIWNSIKYLSDITAILKTFKKDLDWKVVVGISGEMKVKNLVLLGVELANRILGAPVPDDVKMLLQNKRIQSQAVAIEEELKEGTPRGKSIGRYLRQIRYHVFLREHYSTKLKVIYHGFVQIFVPNIFDYQYIGNNNKKYWQMFLTKPFRMVRQHLKRG